MHSISVTIFEQWVKVSILGILELEPFVEFHTYNMPILNAF